jgi:CRISPR-associated protein Csd1
MILQELNNLYRRLMNDPDSGVSPPNYSQESFSFSIVLNTDGVIIGIIDERQDGKSVGRIVPEAVVRSGTVLRPNFMWDNVNYVLGLDTKGKPERALQQFEALREHHHTICGECNDPGIRAVLRFLDSWEPDIINGHPILEPYLELLRLPGNLYFSLEYEGRIEPVYARPETQKVWMEYKLQSASMNLGQCLITGKKQVPIARLHPKISGMGNSTGNSIVSFNRESFTSYRKEQNFNAPISEEAAFAYTTALNWMLERGNPRHLGIAGDTIVFWAEQQSTAEGWLSLTIDPPAETAKEGQDQAIVSDIRHVLREARDGQLARETLKRVDADPETRVFILGMTPNAARIAVRFWETTKLGHLVEQIGRHYADINLKRSEKDEEFPRPGFILKETASQGKWENIPPLLGGQLMQAIFDGSRYPMSLYSALLSRIRADQDDKKNPNRKINYLRAAMIKGILVRNYPNPNKEILTMALNHETTDVAYRLGRLFWVLERLQQNAIKPSSTIKDRYFGAASATPGSVFPQLLRNAQNHIGKMQKEENKKGIAIWGEKNLGEILFSIDSIPTHLDLQAQGRFVLGYYHQRQDSFEKTETYKQENAKEE